MPEVELQYITGMLVVPEGFINYLLAWLDLALVRQYSSFEDATCVRNGSWKLVRRSQLLKGQHVADEPVEISCLLDIVFDGENPDTYQGVTLSYESILDQQAAVTWDTGDVVNDWNNAMAWAYDYEQHFSCVWFTSAVSTFLRLANLDLVELDGCDYPVMTPIRAG